MKKKTSSHTKVRKFRPNFYQKKWSERFLNSHPLKQILILLLVLSPFTFPWTKFITFINPEHSVGQIVESTIETIQAKESWKSHLLENLELAAAFATIYFFVVYGLEYVEKKRKGRENKRFKDNRNKLINSSVDERKLLMDNLNEKAHEFLPRNLELYTLETSDLKTGKEESVLFPAYTLFDDNCPSLTYHSDLIIPDIKNWEKKTFFDDDFIEWLKSVLRKEIYNSETFTFSGWKKDRDGNIRFSVKISDYYSKLIRGERFFYGLIYRGFDENLRRFSLLNKSIFNVDQEIIDTWGHENQKLLAFHPAFSEPNLNGVYGSNEDSYTSIGMSCSLLFRRRGKDNKEFFTTYIHEKSAEANVIERYHIIPAGMYQPGRKTQALRDADIKHSILREVAEELYGLKEAHKPLSNEFYISHYLESDEPSLLAEGLNALNFHKFLNSNPEFKIINLSVDILRAHFEINSLMIVDYLEEGFGDFEEHVKSFGLNFETKDLIVLDFYKGVSLEKSLQDALIIKNSISELPFTFVATGIVTLQAAYQEAQRLLVDSGHD